MGALTPGGGDSCTCVGALIPGGWGSCTCMGALTPGGVGDTAHAWKLISVGGGAQPRLGGSEQGIGYKQPLR